VGAALPSLLAYSALIGTLKNRRPHSSAGGSCPLRTFTGIERMISRGISWSLRPIMGSAVEKQALADQAHDLLEQQQYLRMPKCR
jgi:hypothetical protein